MPELHIQRMRPDAVRYWAFKGAADFETEVILELVYKENRALGRPCIPRLSLLHLYVGGHYYARPRFWLERIIETLLPFCIGHNQDVADVSSRVDGRQIASVPPFARWCVVQLYLHAYLRRSNVTELLEAKPLTQCTRLIRDSGDGSAFSRTAWKPTR